MSGPSDLKQGFKRIKRDLKRAAGEVRERAAAAGGADTERVNVAGRSNVVVSTNVGGDSVHSATASQRVRIRQQDGETTEATETTSASSNTTPPR